MGRADICASCCRKVWSKISFFVLSLVICSGHWAVALPVSDDKKQIDALLIKQTSFYYGDHTIYLTRDAFKDVFEKNGTISIARAPDWNVVTFNPLKKLFVENPKNSMSGLLLKPFDLMGENNIHEKAVIPTAVTTFKGFRAQNYASPSTFSRHARQLYSEKKISSSDLGRIDMTNVLVTINDGQRAILAKMFDLPLKPGLTVQCIKTSLDGSTESHLLTSLIQKVKVSDADMRMATSYKKVKEHAQLLNYSESTNDGLLKMMIGDGKKSR